MTAAGDKRSKRERLTRRTLLFQVLGFGLVIVVLWLDEVWDLPHLLLGAERTPINWRESILESIVVAIIGGQTFAWMDEAMGRIRHLEGLLVVCAHCRKIRVSGQWVAFEQFLSEHSEAEYAHMLCPACDEKLYGNQDRWRKRPGEERVTATSRGESGSSAVSGGSSGARVSEADGRTASGDAARGL